MEVDRADGQGYQALPLNEVAGVPQQRARVAAWLPLAIEKGLKYGVPPSWILGVIYAESGGNEKAVGSCGKADKEHNHCTGLMQIYAELTGIPWEKFLDGDFNMEFGTKLLAKSRAKGRDLPQAAAIHNAGSIKSGACTSAKRNVAFPDGSPYGMCEEMLKNTGADGAVGYIDRVVRASNMMLEHFGDQIPKVGPANPNAGGTTTEPPPVHPGQLPLKPAGVGPIALGAVAGYLLAAYGLPWMSDRVARALR